VNNYEALVTKLREIFQIDRPELDFGVYRILNARADEVNAYLTTRLKARVAEALSTGAAANSEAQQRELDEAIKQLVDLGVEPEGSTKVKQLRAAIAAASSGASEHENAVFSHLLAFFSRYYDKGDFLSQRRYKGDTYAIPYAGEEVVLHWANKDQYYTKSGEAFSNYGFKLDDGRSVQFRLIAADTAKDNRKDNDKERRFALAEATTVMRTDDDGELYEEEITPIAEEDGDLILRFEYRAFAKGTKQEALLDAAVAAVLSDEVVKARWLALETRAPTEKKPQRTTLEKYLTNYTQKNTADYFIHKDLGTFLRRELDFYIKNEVMHLDDVQNADAFAAIERNLRMIQCLRAIALDLITFLATIEDFQKKLWLKKKFVVSAHYCVTLDRVPAALYPAIAANPAQWAQWYDLGMRGSAEPGSAEDLKANLYLMVDTALFNAAFRAEMLKAIPDLDASTDGLLVHGDNFQALTLLTERYRNAAQAIYIDPPYNTDAGPIAYKNELRSSSWMTLMASRIEASRGWLKDSGVLCATIDDYQIHELAHLLDDTFGSNQQIGTVMIRNNPSGRSTVSGISVCHEYALFYGNSENSALQRLPRSEKQLDRFSIEDGKHVDWRNFRKDGGAVTYRSARPKQYYPIYVADKSLALRVPTLEWVPDRREWAVLDPPSGSEIVVLPFDDKGRERIWSLNHTSAQANLDDLEARKDKQGQIAIYRRHTPNEGVLPRSWWDKNTYAAREYGSATLSQMFGGSAVFSFAKSPFAVEDCIRVSGLSDSTATVVDYFAGSGTTAHATIALNRADEGSRRYVLVDQGEYFDTVLKPRIQKVVYSAEWKDGKPLAPETGISHAFKVLKIESYEDTLNNLMLSRAPAQAALLDSLDGDARDDYLMRYMLDVEARGSILSVADFAKPFDYTLNIAVDSAGAFERRNVDMVETFNYLIGLTVNTIDIQIKQGFCTVEGTLPSGERALILWRDCDVLDYDGLAKLCSKLAINPGDSEYDVVYLNGDHNIPSVLTSSAADGEVTKTLKLRQIEPAFLEAMFSTADA
jgi:adenine-specific DNA-methyltransferase